MVSDVTASVTKATSLGAKTVMAREDMPGVGTWSILGDPQGAVFAIFQSAR
jgi:predicted enzyme related to lactoylglutathione lyase